MKPLTIDELKALPVGEWVWVVRGLDTETPCSHYGEIEGYGTVSLTHSHEYLFVRNRGVHNLKYSDYGKTWLAYKNKEAAEAKGEIVELPCIAMIEQGLVDGKMKQTQEAQGFNGRYSVVYMDKTKCKIPLIDVCWSKESKCRYAEAERRLAELKGEKT